jgi:hypothetical protein
MMTGLGTTLTRATPSKMTGTALTQTPGTASACRWYHDWRPDENITHPVTAHSSSHIPAAPRGERDVEFGGICRHQPVERRR